MYAVIDLVGRIEKRVDDTFFGWLCKIIIIALLMFVAIAPLILTVVDWLKTT